MATVEKNHKKKQWRRLDSLDMEILDVPKFIFEEDWDWESIGMNKENEVPSDTSHILETAVAFDKATVEGLMEIERTLPHLIGHTDNVWKNHCKQNFRGRTPATLETWRDFYYRCSAEQYARFERTKTLTTKKKIKSKRGKATSVRITKFAHVKTTTDLNLPKPIQKSKKLCRKGKKGSKTGQYHDASTSLDGSGNSNNDNIVTEVTSTFFGGISQINPAPSSSSLRKTPASKKPKKAPLMQKCLKRMKLLFMHR